MVRRGTAAAFLVICTVGLWASGAAAEELNDIVTITDDGSIWVENGNTVVYVGAHKIFPEFEGTWVENDQVRIEVGEAGVGERYDYREVHIKSPQGESSPVCIWRFEGTKGFSRCE